MVWSCCNTCSCCHYESPLADAGAVRDPGQAVCRWVGGRVHDPLACTCAALQDQTLTRSLPSPSPQTPTPFTSVDKLLAANPDLEVQGVPPSSALATGTGRALTLP